MNITQILEAKGSHCYSIASDKTLKDAVALMMEHRIGSLLVIDDGKLVSIITERDVMWAMNQHGCDAPKLKISEIMADELVTCHGECTLGDAMDLMTSREAGKRIRHLPVLGKDGELLGLISVGDIVKTIIQETEFENKLLKNYIRNWPEDEG